jgi:hypothetical protein
VVGYMAHQQCQVVQLPTGVLLSLSCQTNPLISIGAGAAGSEVPPVASL